MKIRFTFNNNNYEMEDDYEDVTKTSNVTRRNEIAMVKICELKLIE
jgi:hypothetical protein